MNYLKASDSRSGMTCEIISLLAERIAKIFSNDFELKKKYFIILAN